MTITLKNDLDFDLQSKLTWILRLETRSGICFENDDLDFEK